MTPVASRWAVAPSWARPCAAALQVSQTRAYDRKRFKANKKKARALLGEDQMTVEETLSVLRTYCLGENKPVAAHLTCNAEDFTGDRILKAEVMFPRALRQATAIRTLVFAEGDAAEEARAAGATLVGGRDFIEEVRVMVEALPQTSNDTSTLPFDKILATRALFPHIVKVSRVLGPRGLMPSPAKGTVGTDIPAMLAQLQGAIAVTLSEGGVVHQQIGFSGWSDADLLANLTALLTAVRAARPARIDANNFVTDIAVSAPLTPAVQLGLKRFAAPTIKK
ncbi:hypothetical protein CXG81DRAFT_10533 [Caulochytrium protostelioides]|uniref:Ribosomal protein L1 n=1 Tax=Caulochytrium protostelioides TaxID=1555241 RepID=A0A4P9WY42_9FUNG|nr:ribosomal protein L1 [Caulochytrium protostelioides]RKP02673.1 hypothetical protein CXG81DRAFT_10533 [Caulochytrium protostelioides]|eukprot:RKP02673.1 hypothetical protein CXG81DRAFT_10533 [Caulochytrium protostelioides]